MAKQSGLDCREVSICRLDLNQTIPVAPIAYFCRGANDARTGACDDAQESSGCNNCSSHNDITSGLRSGYVFQHCRNLTTRCTAAIPEHHRSSESRAEATQWFVQVFKSSEYASPLEGRTHVICYGGARSYVLDCGRGRKQCAGSNCQ
jgi:hypothetical protein